MKHLNIFIYMLVGMLSVHGAYWEASKEVPYEVRALVSSINLQYLTEEEKDQLQENLRKMDALISKLPQSDRYFLGKASLYKWILQTSSTMQIGDSFEPSKIINKKEYEGLSEFAKWLLIAVKSDIIEISKGLNYQRYLSEKAKGRFTRSTQTIRKKIKLIAPWAKLLGQSNHQQVNLQLMRYQIELLEDISEQYKIYFHFNGFELPLKGNKLSYFKLNKKAKPSESNDKQDSSLGFLDSVIEMHRKKGLPLPENDWTIDPKDTWTPGDDSQIIIKVEKDGSYIAPSELPKPVDDWVLEY